MQGIEKVMERNGSRNSDEEVLFFFSVEYLDFSKIIQIYRNREIDNENIALFEDMTATQITASAVNDS